MFQVQVKISTQIKSYYLTEKINRLHITITTHKFYNNPQI